MSTNGNEPSGRQPLGAGFRAFAVIRWMLVLLAFMGIMSIISRQFHYVPGQEDNPALAKAALCGVANDVHAAMIRRSIEAGLVTTAETRPPPDRVYVLNVDEALWAEEPIESKELLAIAGWCQVAGEDGHAVASVLGSDSRNELATVVDGEFAAMPGYE